MKGMIFMPSYKDEERSSWYCKFYYTDWTGARKSKMKRGFKTKKEAAAWEREFLEKQQGTPDMTFKALVDLYMDDIKARNKESSIRTKTSLINTCLLPVFGEMPINTITPADVRKWQSQLAKGQRKELSSTHIRNIERQFGSIMNFAVRYYNLPVNPHRITGCVGKPAKRKMQYWTQEEFKTFLAATTDPMTNAAVETLFYTGMRIGELLALTMNDIDFEKCTISISKTYSHHNKEKQITSPKTPNSYRSITIPKFLRDHLNDFSKRFYGIETDERLFLFYPEWFRYQMVTICKATGVKFIRIHDIRHSHVSMLIDMGFSPHLIAERIGDTVDMVNNVYGHLYPNRHIEVADKLQEIVSY
jgi:integrase